MLKKLLIGVIILSLLIVGAAHYLLSNLNSIVKEAIEKYGSEAIQTQVLLDNVNLSLNTGEGSLNGLSVSNPKGFSAVKAFYMDALSVKLDTSSVTGNGPIVIREIVIAKPQVTYEVNNQGATNLQTIEHNTTSKASAQPASGSAGGGSSGKSERKIIIKDLYIRDGQIGISQPLLAGKTLSAPLPTIHLTDIGKQQGGATPEQVAEQVLDSIISSASRVASGELSKNLGSSLKDAAGKGVGSVGDQLKGVLR